MFGLSQSCAGEVFVMRHLWLHNTRACDKNKCIRNVRSLWCFQSSPKRGGLAWIQRVRLPMKDGGPLEVDVKNRRGKKLLVFGVNHQDKQPTPGLRSLILNRTWRIPAKDRLNQQYRTCIYNVHACFSPLSHNSTPDLPPPPPLYEPGPDPGFFL